MSRSKGRSSFDKARYTTQLIYLMICVGLPYVPHGGLRPCDEMYHHCRCSFDVWGVPASPPKPCYRLYQSEKRSNVRMQLSQTMMHVFWDDGMFHTVANIGGGHLRHVWSISLCEDSTNAMRRFFHYAMILANDTQFNDDLVHLQVRIGGKNAEIARSTGHFTHSALAYQVQHFPDWVSSQVWYGCIQHKHQDNCQPIHVYHHLRSGDIVVVITCILHANILR